MIVKIRQLGTALLLLSAMLSLARSQSVTLPIQRPLNSSGTAPYYPVQLDQAYGLTALSASGAGQTIAIIDAFNYPNALSAFNTFNTSCGLPQFDQPGGPTFTQLNESGGTALPGTDPAGAGNANGNWEAEEALDVEWAHAMAPNANIILYEATNNDSDGLPHLENAIATAAANPAVSVVSMSWGSSEYSGETDNDSLFTTPANRLAANPKQGVTFVAAAGDSGAPGQYPAFSPNVVAVGGTALSLTVANAWRVETAWYDGGGGTSTQESKPSYQTSYGTLNGGILGSTTSRALPDVALDADPSLGVWTYDPYNGYSIVGSSPGWSEWGGTSLSAPCWAGLIADADGMRSAEGYGTLDGLSQTLPALYCLPSSDFHDITTGNNGFAAGPGYDLATGLGTPIANVLVPDLANYQVAPEPSTLALLAVAGLTALGSALVRKRLARPRR
jgi:subtilase family serine protease